MLIYMVYNSSVIHSVQGDETST